MSSAAAGRTSPQFSSWFAERCSGRGWSRQYTSWRSDCAFGAGVDMAAQVAEALRR